MKAIVVSLRGALRSWGAASLGDDRWTQMRPTASAIVGMVGACAGIDRHDKSLSQAWYSSWDVVSASATDWSVDGRAGVMPGVRSDFQTAQNSMDMSGGLNEDAVVSRRGYLEEARESAAIVLRQGASEQLFDLAVAGLKRPVYTPYLGRRSNPLAEPMLASDGIAIGCDKPEIVNKVIERLRRPGLMESKITVRAIEVQANSGWLSEWLDQLPANQAKDVSLMSARVADQKSGPLGNHAQRMIDMALVDCRC